ncbi:MAG: hypothetical protein D6722_26315 [Bacteroidetes bacterium]|nr:MAG: hypothetical protein D6722_26315 [Bacteroidota bacterium]
MKKPMPRLALIVLLWLGFLACQPPASLREAAPGLRVSLTYPQYFRFRGKPTLLLGGSVEDNLFQLDSLIPHLDRLQAAGGNYVRNTMSSRDPGNRWPFFRQADGLYDLRRMDSAYWARFEGFLAATHARDIVVQLEVWATFDFYREPWQENPFNPANNINYDSARSGLSTRVPSHPTRTENPFFRSVPLLDRPNATLLRYQQAFVDTLLAHSLRYDHVLYCMDNETSVTAAWGRFWATYIQKKAAEAGKNALCTEMWDPWDLNHVFHRETFDHPETYAFVDISQNNHNTGQAHWDQGMAQIERLRRQGQLRPLTNVKVYGNDGGRHQTTEDAIQAYIRNVFFGAASTRFHRPTSGQGLNDTAWQVIRSLRTLTDSLPFFEMLPRQDLLSERAENEAYCRAREGKAYVVYFPAGGEVRLKAPAAQRLRWLEVLTGQWQEGKLRPPQDTIFLQAPGPGHWIAWIEI